VFHDSPPLVLAEVLLLKIDEATPQQVAAGLAMGSFDAFRRLGLVQHVIERACGLQWWMIVDYGYGQNADIAVIRQR
jgi:uncharacterized protein (DUF2062 family)